MQFNIMIAGVGGQGTVLASRLIAAAAMKEGFDARTTETIGMAQRGGSVFGYVRIGDNIFSPIIPVGKADAIIGFELAETARQLSYLRGGGSVIACNKAVYSAGMSGTYDIPAMIEYLKSNVPNLILIDLEKISDSHRGQNAKTLNVTLLGAAAQSGIFPFKAETILKILPEVLPERILEINIKAFETGRKLCQ